VGFARFEALAEAFWADIPERFRVGAVLLVHPEAQPDAEHPEVFLLGMCEPAFTAFEDAMAWAGDLRVDERQSLVHIWYGSFAALEARATAFAWRDELEETLLHELTHHWEGRAGLDGLDRFDAAQLMNLQRLRGLAVPPGFWRDGEPLGPGRWHIDGDVFVEVAGPPPWSLADPPDGGPSVHDLRPEPPEVYAVLPGRGLPFDGERGDLVVASAPAARQTWWHRLKARWGGAG
jgi:hypothetical protein